MMQHLLSKWVNITASVFIAEYIQQSTLSERYV